VVPLADSRRLLRLQIPRTYGEEPQDREEALEQRPHQTRADLTHQVVVLVAVRAAQQTDQWVEVAELLNKEVHPLHQVQLLSISSCKDRAAAAVPERQRALRPRVVLEPTAVAVEVADLQPAALRLRVVKAATGLYPSWSISNDSIRGYHA